MEGDGRFRTADSDITALQNSEIRLKYLTRDARRIVNDMGLRDLTMFYQVLLMEACYNYNPMRIQEKLNRKRDENPGISANPLITKLSEQSSFRMAKATHSASFNVNGIRNLYTLDRTVVVADYGVNLEDLARELNAVSSEMLGEWLGTVEKKMAMPIALCELQEFLSVMKEGDEELRSKLLVEVPKHQPIGEAERAILEKAREGLKETKKIMEMEDKDGPN